ncbi:hypothetical protein PIECOFPK_01123 [Mycovorax composti]|jgi:hypothetical protein|uniref:ATP synthase subunit I n=2 Tax=Chitinophagaceae TaxID=563835 RepID=A0ABZ2EJ59_9BACT
MEQTSRKLNPVKLMILVFVLLTAFFLVCKDILLQSGVDPYVMVAGNLILFIVGLFTIISGLKAIRNPNPHVFVRVYYAGFIIRLFVCALAAFIYIYLSKDGVSKPSLFACLGIYVLYSFIEVFSLKKALRENSNG